MSRLHPRMTLAACKQIRSLPEQRLPPRNAQASEADLLTAVLFVKDRRVTTAISRRPKEISQAGPASGQPI